MSELNEMREFMRQLLGDDWEVRLILANAIADPDASNEEVHAAQQRAVAHVRDNCVGWTPGMDERVAEAWIELWLAV